MRIRVRVTTRVAARVGTRVRVTGRMRARVRARVKFIPEIQVDMGVTASAVQPVSCSTRRSRSLN